MSTKAKKSVAPPHSDHNTMVVEMFREDPEFAAEYLNQVLEDGEEKELLIALRRIAEAFGGVSELAKRTNLHAKTLYRTLSQHGNPELRSLKAILGAMGMRIAVAPLKPAKPTRRRVAARAV